MNKKGESHVDWAVSMGIFLVYVMSMFMLIQPGIQPFYSETNLVGIIENQLDLNLNYEIAKTPIYIDITSVPPEEGLKPEQYVEIDMGGSISKSDIKLVYQAKDVTETESKFLVTSVPKAATSNIKFANPTGSPLQKADNPSIFIVYYSKGRYNYGPNADLNPGEPFSARIITHGTTEYLRGIDEQALTEFESLNCDSPAKYQELKEKWAFPPEKEFSLYYVEAEQIPYDMKDAKYLCNQVQPYDQSNVYAKEWSEWILNPDGTIKPVIYNIRIWRTKKHTKGQLKQ